MGKYSDSEKWEDVVPIPQDDGGPNPLAAIAYTEEYSEAMSYLRAVMAEDEKSERVLELTGHIIRMNPAHYTVWLYRASVVFAIERDLLQELEWLNRISLKHLKNYQIWYYFPPLPPNSTLSHSIPCPMPTNLEQHRHHRQTIMTHIPTLPTTELPFLNTMFSRDAKNYHVWSYRQWLVRHFSLWDNELTYIETLLRDDIRNNSAWNHRWFVVFARHVAPDRGTGREALAVPVTEPAIVQREMEYAKAGIALAPQNQSPWSYLRACVRMMEGGRLGQLRGFAEGFADVEREEEVRSSHALDLLAEVYAEEEGERERAGRVLELLARRYDPIRKNYWDYRRGLLGLGKASG